MADDAVTTPQDDTGAAADTSILTEAPEAPKPEGDTPPSDEPKATDTDPKEGEKPADGETKEPPKADGPPEKYEFTMPEGYARDEGA